MSRSFAALLVIALAGCSSERGTVEVRPDPPPRPETDLTEAEPPPAEGPRPDEPRPDEPSVEAPEPEEPARAPLEVEVVRECEPLRAAPEERLHVEREVVYSRAGGEPILLDLLRPRTDELRPAVLLIHGGGWRRGERAHVDSMARALAAEGFVGVALDFRLADAPRVVFPGPIADARCAVRWLRTHGPEHGVDPDRIGAVGFSSGGHMAAMLATASDVEGLDEPGCEAPEDAPVQIQAAAVWFAPIDLRRRIGRHSSQSHIRNLLGARPEQVPDRVALASPIVHVDAGDAPILLVHGTEDSTVDVVQSTAFRDALVAAGAQAFYAELPGAGHGFGLLSREPLNRAGICTTLEFLRKALLER